MHRRGRSHYPKLNSRIFRACPSRDTFNRQHRSYCCGRCPDPRDRLLVILGLNTGLRISELLALRWRQLVRNGEPTSLLEVSRRFLKS
jgi:integrase